jgi:phosphoadenosine phosphosulfate reductase
VELMVREHGINLFYQSVEKRKLCCSVRKLHPLKRALGELDAWVCGLRRGQAVTRHDVALVEWDAANELVKFNPLWNWTEQDLQTFVKEHAVPYSPLHDQGFISIGCSCCTRAIKPGEDLRAGRWWWEDPEHKECGLHQKEGKLLRI